MVSAVRALQVFGNTGIVPPWILEKLPSTGDNGSGGVVPPHLQPQPEAPGCHGNTGVVPPHLQPRPDAPGCHGNTGVVPPHLQPKPNAPADHGNTGVVPPHLRPRVEHGVPGNTGIVPPYLLDRIEHARPSTPSAPVLQTPATGHVLTREDPFSVDGAGVVPGSFGRCPPGTAEELARSPGGRQLIDAWFQAAAARANAGSGVGGYEVEFFEQDNAWQFNFQGTGTWYQFDGDVLRVVDTEGERTVAVEKPLTPHSLIDALERA